MPAGTFNTPEYQAEVLATRKRIERHLECSRVAQTREFILNTLAKGITTADLERIAAMFPKVLLEHVRRMP